MGLFTAHKLEHSHWNTHAQNCCEQIFSCSIVYDDDLLTFKKFGAVTGNFAHVCKPTVYGMCVIGIYGYVLVHYA